MSNSDKKKRTPHKEWGIYILIILGIVFMFSAILYVINSEKPIETYPPTTIPPTTPHVTTPPSPPATSAPTTLPPTATSAPTTLPPTATPPETKPKIEWTKNLKKAEMGEYITDNRIGVKVLKVYNPIGTASTAVEILFENRTEVSQPFDLENIFLFDKGEQKYKLQWIEIKGISFEVEDFKPILESLKELHECINEIPSKNGLRVILHFNTTRSLPDYITFENYYYKDLESSKWIVKVRY